MKTVVTLALAGVLALGAIAPAAAQERVAVKVDGKGNAKGLQKLIIGQFTVGFVTERFDQATAKGFQVAGIGGGKAILQQNLTGVSDAEMQAATDAAYEDFVAKLKAAGFDVADRAPLLANAKFAEAKTVTAPYEGGFVRDRGNVKIAYFGATETAPYHLTTEATKGGVLSGFSMMSNAMGYGTGVANFVAVNKAYVVDVIYALDFAQAKRSGGFAANVANVKADAALTVLVDQSRVQVHAPSMNVATLSLTKPVELPADFFTQSDVTTGTTKRNEAITNALSSLIGSGGSSKTKEIAFTAAPGRYGPAAADAAKTVNAAMVEQLAAIR